MDERNWNGFELLENVEQPCTYVVPVVGLEVDYTSPPGTNCPVGNPVACW